MLESKGSIQIPGTNLQAKYTVTVSEQIGTPKHHIGCVIGLPAQQGTLLLESELLDAEQRPGAAEVRFLGERLHYYWGFYDTAFGARRRGSDLEHTNPQAGLHIGIEHVFSEVNKLGELLAASKASKHPGLTWHVQVGMTETIIPVEDFQRAKDQVLKFIRRTITTGEPHTTKRLVAHVTPSDGSAAQSFGVRVVYDAAGKGYAVN